VRHLMRYKVGGKSRPVIKEVYRGQGHGVLPKGETEAALNPCGKEIWHSIFPRSARPIRYG
jgi:hypothetical protein